MRFCRDDAFALLLLTVPPRPSQGSLTWLTGFEIGIRHIVADMLQAIDQKIVEIGAAALAWFFSGIAVVKPTFKMPGRQIHHPGDGALREAPPGLAAIQGQGERPLRAAEADGVDAGFRNRQPDQQRRCSILRTFAVSLHCRRSHHDPARPNVRIDVRTPHRPFIRRCFVRYQRLAVDNDILCFITHLRRSGSTSHDQNRHQAQPQDFSMPHCVFSCLSFSQGKSMSISIALVARSR